MSGTNAPEAPGGMPDDTQAVDFSRRSLAAQAMGHVDPATRAVVMPLHVATTFIRDPDNAYSSGFSYARPDNQTVREAEEIIRVRIGRMMAA